MTARSVSGSSPTSCDSRRRPSESATAIVLAPCTTWLLVSAKPSCVNRNPEPCPGTSGTPDRPRRRTRCWPSTGTTAGPTRSAAPITVRDCASSGAATLALFSGLDAEALARRVARARVRDRRARAAPRGDPAGVLSRMTALLCLLVAGAVQLDSASFVMRDFRFASGATLPELRLHYLTLGRPRRDAAGVVRNAVLILHGTGGSGNRFLSPLFAGEPYGPKQPLDTATHYIILPDD